MNKTVNNTLPGRFRGNRPMIEAPINDEAEYQTEQTAYRGNAGNEGTVTPEPSRDRSVDQQRSSMVKQEYQLSG